MIHLSGAALRRDNGLQLFVIFVDQMIFLGLVKQDRTLFSGQKKGLYEIALFSDPKRCYLAASANLLNASTRCLPVLAKSMPLSMII